MARFLIFYLLVLLCSAFALKGKNHNNNNIRTRRLVEEKSIKSNKSKSQKDEKTGKSQKDGKSQKGETKSAKKGKKCKKSAKTDDEIEKEDDDFLDNNEVCLDYDLDANCDALRREIAPVIPNDADSAIGGTLLIELTSSKTTNDAIEKMNEALNDIALEVVGCEDKIIRSIPIEKEKKAEGRASLNGVTIQDLTKSNADCKKAKDEDDCTVLESPITIYYSGDASAEQLNYMASSISDKIRKGEDDGKYKDFATVHRVETTIGQFKASNTLRGGTMMGAAFAALALIAIGMAGLLYTRRRHASINPEKNPTEFSKGKSIVKKPTTRELSRNFYNPTPPKDNKNIFVAANKFIPKDIFNTTPKDNKIPTKDNKNISSTDSKPKKDDTIIASTEVVSYEHKPKGLMEYISCSCFGPLQ